MSCWLGDFDKRQGQDHFSTLYPPPPPDIFSEKTIDGHLDEVFKNVWFWKVCAPKRHRKKNLWAIFQNFDFRGPNFFPVPVVCTTLSHPNRYETFGYVSKIVSEAIFDIWLQKKYQRGGHGNLHFQAFFDDLTFPVDFFFFFKKRFFFFFFFKSPKPKKLFNICIPFFAWKKKKKKSSRY